MNQNVYNAISDYYRNNMSLKRVRSENESNVPRRHQKKSISQLSIFLEKVDRNFYRYLKSWYIRYIILNKFLSQARRTELEGRSLGYLLEESLDDGDSGPSQFLNILNSIEHLRLFTNILEELNISPEEQISLKNIKIILHKVSTSFLAKDIADYCCCGCRINSKRFIRNFYILTGFKCKLIEVKFENNSGRFNRSEKYKYESRWINHTNDCRFHLAGESTPYFKFHVAVLINNIVIDPDYSAGPIKKKNWLNAMPDFSIFNEKEYSIEDNILF